jgi:TolA-binding protein
MRSLYLGVLAAALGGAVGPASLAAAQYGYAPATPAVPETPAVPAVPAVPATPEAPAAPAAPSVWALAPTPVATDFTYYAFGSGYGVGRARGARFRTEPAEPWLAQDPADSLYKLGRRALTQGRYQEASDAFRRIVDRHPRSGYAADALYWHAFALYQLGGTTNLRVALARLERQRKEYPKAATRGDAAALETRIKGQLARLGDPQAAQEIYTIAELGGTAPKAPRPPKAPKAPKVPVARVAGQECGDEDDVKTAALNALLQMDDERALPILKRVMARRDAGSACLRRKAVFLVSRTSTSETEQILLDAVRNDPDAEVRSQAIFWLSRVDGDRATPLLDSIARASKDPEVQKKAIFALSQRDDTRAKAALRAFAEREDVSDEIRADAIFWLGNNGGAEEAGYLRSLYPKLRDQELKNKVIFAISRIDQAGSGSFLLGIAKNANEPVELRKQALFWASQAGKVTAADLGELYTSMPDREMRNQIIFSLSRSEDPAALDRLIDIVRRETDVELRKSALFWIGRSDDPRAAQILTEVLEGR